MQPARKFVETREWAPPAVVSLKITSEELARIDAARSPQAELRSIYLERTGRS